MLVKIFGVVDMLTAITLIIVQYFDIPFRWIIIFAAYMLLKSVMFLSDLFSIIDGVIGVYLILMIFNINSMLITLMFSAYLIIKGIWSLT